MDSEVNNLAEAMLACGDVTRLRILNLLFAESELCVYDLVEVIGASQPKISRHLAYLRRAGLVSYRKDGLWVYYRLSSRVASPNGVLLDSLEAVLRSIESLDADRVTLDRARVRPDAVVTEDRRYRAVVEKRSREPIPALQAELEPYPPYDPSYESELEIELL